MIAAFLLLLSLFPHIGRLLKTCETRRSSPIDHAESILTLIQADNKTPITPTSRLTLLPAELLLHIASFLPPENVACLALASKHYYSLLRPEVDLTLPNPKEKQRFLRLLEEDHPELLACRNCNILYRWRNDKNWLCPRHFRNGHYILNGHYSAVRSCGVHKTMRVYPEIVDAYLRGSNKGPAYGPQLSGLAHRCEHWSLSVCKRTGCFGKADNTSMAMEARVVDGKFILHSVNELWLPLPARIPRLSFQGGTGSRRSIVDIEKDFAYAIDQMYFLLGCQHARVVPAIVMDVLQGLHTPSSRSRKCHGLLHCALCATDLRVAVVAESEHRVKISLKVWYCFGGRELEQRTPCERLLLDGSLPFTRPSPSDITTLRVPTRDLERRYSEESDDSAPASEATNPPHSWLHEWDWRYNALHKVVRECRVPDD
ncbi:hypothetical protein LTR46_000777 [Exophiala xenobiotica]|nr:hypothetical protein LTR46_000777 [Exophiala xenobiotica]